MFDLRLRTSVSRQGVDSCLDRAGYWWWTLTWDNMLTSRVSRVIMSRASRVMGGSGDILDLREVSWGVVGLDNMGVEWEVGNIGRY